MSLSNLPREILLDITDHLGDAGINALAHTNSQIYHLLNRHLYRRDVVKYRSKSLTWAAENGVEGTVQHAINAGQHFTPIPRSFNIALQIAADRGHVHLVEMLLQVDGINVNFRRGSLKATPLGLAAKRGHDAIVELLLAADNVDPNIGDRESTTPLHWACAMGHVSVVEQLLAQDSIDVNAHGTIDGYRETPLMVATRKRSVEVLEALLARDDLDINIGSDSGEYVLGLATSLGHVDTMKLLLNHPGIDPNFVEGDGRTALMVSMRTSTGPEAVQLLLDQEGIDVNIRNNWGLTALCEASVISCCSDLETAKLLLERKDIDVNLPDNYGWTPLFWACHHRCVALVDLLLEKDNIDPNPRDTNSGRTPLAYVCHGRFDGFDERVPSIVQSLLSHPATDPNAVDNNGVGILAGFINKHHNAVGSDGFVRQKIESLLRARIL